ncbi:Acyl-CoA dehydrogenase [Desulfofundulus australicus DSM 11792]|uniref:Acyl-CoA dehydrogenase n=1 Tax=Desulfofundulus australicus DSM 11792 TaxID=1121425 RepID=A0A1M4X725_9FIRM|nr:acyl-CoA dehydrogenase [Desulfofundulus australicus]SHE89278.1 Acyl-CoA dehydrogenase [Desulfofundulus australicus DSM 11792]
MAEFVYDLRDLKFIVKEWLDMEEIFNLEKFRDNYGFEDIDLVLDEAYKIAREVIFPINKEGDRTGVKFENGRAILPPAYVETYRFLQENGWGSANESLASETAMPLTLYRAYNEMFMAASPALMSYVKLTTGAANLIYRFGTDKDRRLFLDKMLSGKWSGTMCLTEPNAGSDVGDATTRAYPTDDPRIYKIKGTKMFITGGEVNLGENIIHMVLARPEGGAPGSRGLGLYIVPKIWVNDDGSLGEPNDVTCIAIENKMGLKASATAMLSFGENDNCRGILVGDPPDSEGRSKGLAMMFHMMNESRIGTGHNALAQMAAAYYFAARYAVERIQGRPFTNPKAGRVPIIKHEDIRRMLMEMKAQVEAIRAMIFRGFYYLDIAEHSGDREKAALCRGYADILTPLIKTYASETAWPMIALAIQVHGGAGYTEEYPVSQYARDAKILSIWEGTSFIQAMDLVNRKMRMKDGSIFAAWLDERRKFIEQNKEARGFGAEMQKLEKAYRCVAEIRELYASYYENMAEKGELIPLYALRVLTCCAQLFAAESIMDQALLAARKIEEPGTGHHDYAYYAGKISTAKYFIHNILPHVYLLTDLIKEADRSALECPEEALVIG